MDACLSKMSTQPYFTNKLGFDPNELMHDGVNGNLKKNHGYEENLSKFKGTSIWGFFIESKGTVVVLMYFFSMVFQCGVDFSDVC